MTVDRRKMALILVGGGLVLALGIGGGIVARRMLGERNAVPFVRSAAAKWKVPFAWLMAIVGHESGFDSQARATDPRDLARGGSFGYGQMSYKTAVGLGYKGSPEGLMDPVTNLDFVGKLVAQLQAKYGNSLADVAAAYNSGKPMASAPAETRTKYVPDVLARAGKYAPAAVAGLGGTVLSYRRPRLLVDPLLMAA